MTSTQKTLWAEFLWANAHMKKIPDSYDVNTEDTMGRLPMGKTLAQEEKPLAIMTSTWETLWDIQLSIVGHLWKICGILVGRISVELLQNLMGHLIGNS